MKHPPQSLTERLDTLFNSLSIPDSPNNLKLHFLGTIKRLLATAAPYCKVPPSRQPDPASYLLEHLTPFCLTAVEAPPQPGIYLVHSGLFVGFARWSDSHWSTFFYDYAAHAEVRGWLWHISHNVSWSALDFKPTGQTPKSPTSKAPNPSSLA